MKNTSASPIRVGISGLGRSGWNIHAKAILQRPQEFQIIAVNDPDLQRRQEAERTFGCRSYETVEELTDDRGLDLIVVATPNRLHTEHTCAALDAGKHVVCEKPFALNVEDADHAIERAKHCNRIIAPFQNRRYDPLFLKVREVIDSGVLGRIVQIRIAEHTFARRWDWQTLREFGGGSLNNSGSHHLDQALELFGDGEPEVFCHLDTALSSGDADDHAKIALRGQDKPLIEVEISAACAYPQDRWLVMGTSGGLRAHGNEAEWRWVDFQKMPDRLVETQPTPARSYNSEQEELVWQEEKWIATGDSISTTLADSFYADLYQTLRHDIPLAVTPESVRKLIATLDRCHMQAPGQDVLVCD